MPIADIVRNTCVRNYITLKKESDNMNTQEKDKSQCECKPEPGYPWFVPPCPVPVPPPMPYPYPPYPHPTPVPTPDVEPEKDSASQQICKLSRKASVITKMLNAIDTQKKDVFIATGGLTYNFGNIDLDLGEGWPDGSYAATVKRILNYELSLIKTKIAELAEEIGEEVDDIDNIIETTVGG